jgi:hypothetical protein
MVDNSSPTAKTKDLIESLTSLKFAFSPADSREKAAIIRALAQKTIRNPASLQKYHDTLCFMQAYPDNPRLLKLVDGELTDFAKRIEYFREINGPDDDRIDDTGMVNTTIHYSYGIHMARWLVKKYGAAVDIDWDDYNTKEADPLSALLNLFALYMENDGIDDENLSTEDWIVKAIRGEQTSLGWLLRKLDGLEAPLEIKQHLYDNSELTLRWELGRTKAARTLAKNPPRRIYYHKAPLKKAKVSLKDCIRKGPPSFSLLAPKAGTEIINTLIRAQLPRHRELYPVFYANPEEVYMTSVGRGLEIFVLGMLPEYRMPLEANYSALLVKNGVPIGYGIGVLFFERCEIAINVFDTFRSGEAVLIFEHFFRVFYHHFGARAFLMRRWQVGHENEEGLQSGSFWFYYKVGFRSFDPRISELAQEEWQKIQRDKTYRTDTRTLKRLALSDLVIDLRPKSKNPFKELPVTDIGMAVTSMIADRFRGDNRKALAASKRAVRNALNIRDLRSWTTPERLQFERWSPLLASIPDLSDWRMAEKQNLVRLIRSKAGKREKSYVGLLQRHRKLFVALTDLATQKCA